MQKVYEVLAALLITTSSYAQSPPNEGPSELSDMFYQAETYRITGRSDLAKEAYTKILQDIQHTRLRCISWRDYFF